MKSSSILIFVLIILEFFVGVTAVQGGFGLIITNGLGVPVYLLSGSPFDSFLIPGLFLLFVVGGTSLAASYSLLRKYKRALDFSAISGISLLIFEFVQLYVIRIDHVLQIVYFGAGILILALTIILLRRNIKKV